MASLLFVYTNNYFIHVEILCTTIRKTLCNTTAKLCAFLHHTYTASAKLYFPTYFSYFSHHLFHHHFTSMVHQSFPLFHIPYYHYYNIYLIIINNKRSLL